MAAVCQLSAVAAVTMVALVLAAAIATLTSVIMAQEPLTPGKNCYRKCMPGDVRTCQFNFEVQLYQTMSRACYDCPRNMTDCSRPECIPGDGIRRRIVVVNKQMPGPHIQVCEGDTVVIDVKNSLPGAGLTMHWHGLSMKGPSSSTFAISETSLSTPFMDGVTGITQCPINPGSTFRYTFYASKAGTHYYHAQSGFLRGDGVFGPITIRQPPTNNPNRHMYDHDLQSHNIMFHDWLHMSTEDKFTLRYHGGEDNFPDSMLVNGLGPYQVPEAGPVASSIPYKRLLVRPGDRYRMRLINAAILNCPVTVAIDQHILTVIESDGNPIVPINASSLVIYPGERYDVVVQAARDRAKDGYWMSFMGGIDCAETAAHQFAILEYESSHGSFQGRSRYNHDSALLRIMPPKPPFNEFVPDGVQVNSINTKCYEDLICVANLRSHDPLPDDMKETKAEHTFYLAFEMRRIHNAHFYSRIYYDFNLMRDEQQIPTPQINNLSFLPQSVPLLLQKGQSDHKMCNAETPLPSKSCHNDYCECLHMYKVPLGAIVDLVLIDEGRYEDKNHPVHLHGHSFWVIGQDRPNDIDDATITRSEVMAMDARGELMRNFENPVFKDTVTIPDAGYTIVRFKADNPGYWLLHSHLLFHSEIGMNMIIKVGEDHEIPQTPVNFPNCGSYRNLGL